MSLIPKSHAIQWSEFVVWNTLTGLAKPYNKKVFSNKSRPMYNYSNCPKMIIFSVKRGLMNFWKTPDFMKRTKTAKIIFVAIKFLYFFKIDDFRQKMTRWKLSGLDMLMINLIDQMPIFWKFGNSSRIIIVNNPEQFQSFKARKNNQIWQNHQLHL